MYGLFARYTCNKDCPIHLPVYTKICLILSMREFVINLNYSVNSRVINQLIWAQINYFFYTLIFIVSCEYKLTDRQKGRHASG